MPEIEEESLRIDGTDSIDGFREGQIQGALKDQNAWWIGGFSSGLFMSCVGAGCVRMMAEFPVDSSSFSVPQGSTDYKRGYMVGYIKAVQSKQRKAACMGGIWGFFLPIAGIGLLFLF